MNKYLEKIAVSYQVDVPEAPFRAFVSSTKLNLDPQEYKDFNEDTEKNWTGKSMALNAAGGTLGGAYLGAVGGGILGAIVTRNVEGAKLGAKFGAGYGGVIGAASGLNRSLRLAKAEALRKHFPELDQSWDD